MTSSAPESPPPGWYEDPEAVGAERWWSGIGWTAHTRESSGAAPANLSALVDPAPAADITPAIAAVVAKPPRARWGLGSIVSIILTVALFAALAVALSPYWLALPVGVFLVMWFSTSRRNLLHSVEARPANPTTDARVVAPVAAFAAAMGIDMPEVYISPQPVRNAFALTDRHGGLVCIFQGALDALDDDELTAVLAHEVGHLKNRDSVYMTFFESVRVSLTVVMILLALLIALCAAMLTRGRGTALGAVFGGGLLLAGAAAAYVLLAAGQRSREYGADRLAAQTHDDPLALGRALKKLAESPERWAIGEVPVRIAARCIVAPFASGFASGLIASHPSTDRRMARIERLIGDERVAHLQHRVATARAQAVERRQQDAAALVARAQPVPFPSDAPLRPLPGELLWHRCAARAAKPASIDGRRGFEVGEAGELLITTDRAVFATITGRTEWSWKRLHGVTWPGPGPDGGELVVFAVEDRRRNSGVQLGPDDAASAKRLIDLALAQAR